MRNIETSPEVDLRATFYSLWAMVVTETSSSIHEKDYEYLDT